MALRVLVATLLLAFAWAEVTTTITTTELTTEYTATTTRTTSRTTDLSCSIESSTIPNTPGTVSETVTSYCECVGGVTATLATTQSEYGAPVTICAIAPSTTVSATSSDCDRFGGAVYSAAQLHNSTASLVQSTSSSASQKTVQPSITPSSTPSESPSEPFSEGTTSDTETTATALGGAPAETAFATMLALAGFGGMMAILG